MLGKYASMVKAHLPLDAAKVPQDLGDHIGMPKSALTVLSENLLRLSRAAKAEYRSQREIAARAKIDQRTVGRIMSAEHAAGVDKVEALAGVFKLQPWQLMYPELDPGNPPEVSTFSLAAKALAQAYDELPDGREKQDLLAQLLGRLQMRYPSPAPTPDGQEPSGESSSQREPALQKRVGKTPARS
jgi:transcriptional regulator with XRE-family HTH domain